MLQLLHLLQVMKRYAKTTFHRPNLLIKKQTSATLYNFILLMILNPQVQLKAHEELDKVVGHQRLPNFSDQDDLPYINAICMEVLRWFPVIPLGIPHRVIADYEHNGMRIPKGSILLPNAWYGSHASTKRVLLTG